MTDMILVFLLVAATILPAIAAFVLTRLRRAIIAMAICASGSALLLLYTGQAVLAMLQLFVFAGGSATYSIIAVVDADEKSSMTRRAAFITAALLIGEFFVFLLQGFGTSFSVNSGGLIMDAGTAFESQYALLYVAVFILFAAAMMSVVAIKSFSKRYF